MNRHIIQHELSEQKKSQEVVTTEHDDLLMSLTDMHTKVSTYKSLLAEHNIPVPESEDDDDEDDEEESDVD